MATERPILFSAPMVRAILEGRKTQTRRIVKPQPDDNGLSFMRNSPLDWREEVHGEWRQWKGEIPTGDTWDGPTPYHPGLRLWVREAFYYAGWHMGNNGSLRVHYNADGSESEWISCGIEHTVSLVGKKRPSIHMPRWASRITLEVVSIRVERLQDISEADAKAEGCEPAVLLPDDEGLLAEIMFDESVDASCRNDYAALWKSINGSGSWEANPWVWVVEFKRIKP